MSPKQYIAIDLKSFYASVECVERGLNPLDACLVVADESRTAKTICLAVSPALKAFGVPGRPRLFEVVQRISEVNRGRGRQRKSIFGSELKDNAQLAVNYIIARPRMQLYIDYSARIFDIYLRHVAPDDIFVYSIDEVFIDATPYLDIYKISAHDFAMTIIRDVLKDTGITATAGIGTNMYLCKVAMDIVAKKMKPDKDGVRIAQLDETGYRRQLWSHTPLTDFWRVGRGTARRLEANGMYTMGDVARRSLSDITWFYKEFGVNAELLTDHAWGHEPVGIDRVKAYRPATHSISSGQVLQRPYTCAEARNVVKEMADSVALELVEKRIATNQIVLTVGYDSENMSDPRISASYSGPVHTDHYGRRIPRHAHGTTNFDRFTSSSRLIIEKVTELFDRITNPMLYIRRLTLSINNIIPESRIPPRQHVLQYDLFTDCEELERRQKAEQEELARERRRQEAVISLRKRFGKNSILKGLNFTEGATQRERNQQIGGHKA